MGKRAVVNGLGYGRRRDFDVWLNSSQSSSKHGGSLIWVMFRLVKWLIGVVSPINIIAKSVYFIQEYGMGGQYCDGSASRGVASAAMLIYGTGNGSAGDDHHASSKTSKHGHHGQHSVSPQTNTHKVGILLMARVWGTLCAFSSATWALIQSGDFGGETIGHIWKTILEMLKSCLAFIKPNTSSSDHVTASQPGSKKNRRKQQNPASFGESRASTGVSDPDLPITGKMQIIFQIFPDHIRSRALYTQQMRTSEMFITLQRTSDAFPPAQMQIAALSFIILVFGWLFYVDDGYYYRIFLKNSDEDDVTTHSIMPNFGLQRSFFEEQNLANGGPYSAYWMGLTQPNIPDIFQTSPPSILDLVFRIISFGTMASLLMYGRILLPIPEFVAGTNVLKAVRTEARSLGAGAAGRTAIKQNKDLPWVERYKSITTENRLRLYYKVGMIRIMENILLCAILPQTEIVCRITEHCEPGPILVGLSGVTGISGSRYTRGSFDALMKDPFITRTSILVTTFLSAFLLVAQMTVMNRTYLALMGYICGEWRLVREDTGNEKISLFGKHATAPPLRRSTSTLTIMQWDPKRRYQKGDRIMFNDCIYEAMSNSPEGPPFDIYLRAAHDLYSEELGHRSTSSLLSNTSMGCWIIASILCGAMFFWRSAGYNFIPLLLMSAACAIAGSITAHLCDGCSSIIYDLADEIQRGH